MVTCRYFYSILIQFLTEKIDQIIKVHEISKNIEKIEERDIISCDGKESRGSKREETNKKAVKRLNTLSAYSNDYFDEEVCKEIEGKSYEKTVEKAENGLVTREYYMTEDIDWLNNKEKWSGLKSIGMVRKKV